MAQGEIVLNDSVRRLASPTSNAALLEFVADWVDLLADKRFKEAYELTAHDSYFEWTPDKIAKVIKNYGFIADDGLHNCQISKLATTKINDIVPRHFVEWVSDGGKTGHVADVWYDLPLDGVWSDLTATFEVHQLGDCIILVLNEIHVF